MTLLTYLISIPLGVRKAVMDGSKFDTWTSAVIIVGFAIPGFLFAILLIILFAGGSFSTFPAARPHFRRLGAISMVLEDHRLFLAHHAAADLMALGAFATMTLLTKNSFLDEIRKHSDDGARQGLRRTAGALQSHLPQRDADRHRRLPERLYPTRSSRARC